ncbi:MAG: putative porin [Gammaproteobacteria bacterium]|nr:putative porin [Gammaproteobacteria bacterium]MBQ0840693.1 putative porin [Gammaproteobacteria bacterium]
MAMAMVVLASGLYAAPGFSDQGNDLLQLQKTTYRLIDLLVEEGILSADKAQAMKREAESDVAKADLENASATVAAPTVVEPGAVRVTYVPQFIKDEIKQDLRREMKAEVLASVAEQASNERWGMPGAWPEWIERIKINGDVRLRSQSDLFGDGNFENSYVDVNRINDKRSFDVSSQDNYKNYLNTTEDRNRLRVRARMGLSADLGDNWHAGIRLVTGDIDDPVSTNETLGDYGSDFELSVDKAYLSYQLNDGFDRPVFNVTGGRFANPFFSTDLLWDSDYTFEGIAASYKYWFFNQAGGNVNNIFLTAGAFPIEEFGAADNDKWLYGAQLGLDIMLSANHRLQLAASYYDYENIEGVANTVDSRIEDHTAPGFVQKGNTLYDIDSSSLVTDPDGTSQLYALVSDYNIINYTMRLEWLRFNPVNVAFFFDYVHNDGFDSKDILNTVAGRNIIAVGNTIDDRVDGYKYGIEVGRANINKAHDWRLSLAYKYLEADAVVDAFTDSDFHGGGTDAKGYILRGAYGLGPGTALNLTYMSADEIDGVPFNMDTLQVDWISKY